MSKGIFCGEQQIGIAKVEKQGLFYCVYCYCNMEVSGPYQMFIHTDTAKLNLGICPPGGQITVRFPIKKAGEGNLKFTAVLLGETSLVEIPDDDAEFPYLTKLPQAYLRQLGEKYVIDFKD